MLSATALCQVADIPQPAKPDFSVTPMRLAHMQAADFLYISGQSTYADTATIKDLCARVSKAMVQAHLSPTSGSVFVCHAPTPDPKHVMTMDAGYTVPANTPAAGDCKIGMLSDNLCATILYTGPADSMAGAIGAFYAQVYAGGHQPTDILRVRNLYWENPDSLNNVVQLEIELQK
jgi:DNA gyrase inhibitor GyrI